MNMEQKNTKHNTIILTNLARFFPIFSERPHHSEDIQPTNNADSCKKCGIVRKI
jgi:hypothetical protein